MSRWSSIRSSAPKWCSASVGRCPRRCLRRNRHENACATGPDGDDCLFTLDITKAINGVMKVPPSTGLTEAIVRELKWTMGTSGKVASWMGARLKDQAMFSSNSATVMARGTT